MSFTAIPVKEFLERRQKSMSEAHAASGLNDIIIVDPEDDIICDVCNADATEESLKSGMVWVTDWGLYCIACRKKNVTRK